LDTALFQTLPVELPDGKLLRSSADPVLQNLTESEAKDS